MKHLSTKFFAFMLLVLFTNCSEQTEKTSDFSDRPSNYGTIVATITERNSGWLAARCFEEVEDNVRFAHSAPVFVEIPAKPFRPKRYAAEYFLAKTEELIAIAEKEEFKTPEARKETMDVYNRAHAVYSDLVKRSR